MNTVYLKQEEADFLIAVEKESTSDNEYQFPLLGGSLIIPLRSIDMKEDFLLDITRSSIVLSKTTYQNRGRKVFVLARLDIGGPPHRNPDNIEIPCPHLHLYREGFGDKWAISVPDDFTRQDDIWDMMNGFFRYCNISTPPKIPEELFS